MDPLEEMYNIIENLPEDVGDMLTSVRNRDLRLEQLIKEKSKETTEFFRYAEDMQPNKRDSKFESLMTECKTTVSDAIDDKINLVDQLESLLIYHTKHLDEHIGELKIKLEAKNPGITAAIEAKVAKTSDKSSEEPKKQKRKRMTKGRKKSSASLSSASNVDEVPAFVVNQEEEIDNATVENASNYDTRRYCICNQEAYGEMIGCDNKSCPTEWFHYDCMNLTVAPEGKWYCPACRPRNCKVYLRKC